MLFQDAKYNIDQYEDGKFDTLFYIPSSTEICHLDNKVTSEMKNEIQFPPGTIENITENDLEKPIRTIICQKPTFVKNY